MNDLSIAPGKILRGDDIYPPLVRTCARICLETAAPSHFAMWGPLTAADEDAVVEFDASAGLHGSGHRTTGRLLLRILHALDLPIETEGRRVDALAFRMPRSGHERVDEVRALEALFLLNGREMPIGILEGLDENEPRPHSWRRPAPSEACQC